MNETLLRVYYSLPNWTRSVVATGRGAYLNYWRYDGNTERLVEEALDREHWTATQWKIWREERLAFILNRAATKVPYYRAVWEKRRRSGSRASWQYLENWEILDKALVRKDPAAFVADDCKTWQMFPEHTSGTTAKPITMWRTREVQKAWYALTEARMRRWYGITRRTRWGIFGGQLIVPVADRKPPFWIWNAAYNQLYMSSYHLAPDLIGYYLDAISKYKLEYLLGYTSALHSVAQQILRAGRTDIKMKVVITNAEPVSDIQRRDIAKAFQCPLRETYGAAEIVSAAGECQEGKLHLWPEVGITETLDGTSGVENEMAGEMVCTGLLNPDMPLIRYRIGDCAALEPDSESTSCACGRSLPRMKGLQGRIDDVLHTRDGRAVGRLDPAFKGEFPIHEAQIIQESLERVRVLYVPADGFVAGSGEQLVRAIRERLGSVEVILEAVNQVPREKNGKFRAVICKVPPEQRNAVAVHAN